MMTRFEFNDLTRFSLNLMRKQRDKSAKWEAVLQLGAVAGNKRQT